MERIKAMQKHSGLIIPYLGLLAVLAIFMVTTQGKVFSEYNVRIIIQQSISLSIICLGAVFIYSLGNSDVSIGVCLGLCTLIEITIINATDSIWLGFIGAVVLAVAFGLVNGAVSSYLGLPSIITSLVLMFLGGGVQTLITLQTNTITTEYDFSFFKQMWVQVFAIAAVLLATGYLYTFTRIGKYVRAIGANQASARQSGVNVFNIKIAAYVILAVCIAISSVFVLARSGSSSRVTGSGYHIDVMVALMLGGMPLSGGMKSRLSAGLVGAVTYNLLTNGLTLSGVGLSYVPFVKALIFIVIVSLTCRKKGGVLPR